MSEALTKNDLLRGLATRSIGSNLYVFETIDSTNACARTLAEAGSPGGTVVWSEFQSAGRGRLGRSWMGDPHLNIMCSVLLRREEQAGRADLPYLVAESVAASIERSTGLAVQARWPNDLLLNGRKCCGILIEAGTSDDGPFAVAGIGINVNQTALPLEIGQVATSLAAETGAPVDRRQLFQTVLTALEQTLTTGAGSRAAALERWTQRCTTFGKRVTVTRGSERLSGTALRLADDGGLVLDTSHGPTVVHAGDVTVEK